MKVEEVLENKLSPEEEKIVDDAMKKRLSIQATADLVDKHRAKKAAKNMKRRATDKK
jgi:hypothetical protein